MKLSECTYGVMVIDADLRVGHVVGVTYNVSLQYTGNMMDKEKLERTIPLVQFAEDTAGIHHGNLDIFKG